MPLICDILCLHVSSEDQLDGFNEDYTTLKVASAVVGIGLRRLIQLSLFLQKSYGGPRVSAGAISNHAEEEGMEENWELAIIFSGACCQHSYQFTEIDDNLLRRRNQNPSCAKGFTS